MLHSISDLTTFCRRTTGDVPAKLVGASTTVVGDKMYLFGGRLVAERRMVADLYAFDLETFNWEKITYSQDDVDDIPRPRYFHSADAWNDHLVVFGGMSNKVDSANLEDLCVLNDVRIFNLTARRWLPSADTNLMHLPSLVQTPSESLVPRARYAHLSSVTSDRLFIIGGQDFNNVWLDDVCVYDLKSKAWVRRSEYPRHCGTYRSVAVSSNMTVQLPQQDPLNNTLPMGPDGARFPLDQNKPPKADVTPSNTFIHLPHSAQPTEETPCDIYLYSNYNFTDVKRELEVFSPLPSSSEFSISDHSSLMKGNSFPPGLRFPTGAILGTHFIVAGTYLAHTYQSFSIWALDLLTMTWSRIDPGNAVASGSWFRACLWPEKNKFYVFGNRHGNLVDDYNRRLLSWEDVAVVDLEAFGIYQPPKLLIDVSMQELGLAALEEGVNTDFEIICEDGRKIACSRKILEARWPWFKEQRQRFLQVAMHTLEGYGSDSGGSNQLATVDDEERPDPRMTPRALHLSEPYPITMALLQYFYSTALMTPLQQAPAVLSQLLILATTYEVTHLQELVKHSMHRALSNTTSVGVYEVATLCNCRSLQIRALKSVMSYSQKRPRVKQDKEAGGSDRPPPDGGSSRFNGAGSHGHDSDTPATRPRGTSDAYWRGNPGGGNSQGATSRTHTSQSTSKAGSELSTIVDEDEGDAALAHAMTSSVNPSSPSPNSKPTATRAGQPPPHHLLPLSDDRLPTRPALTTTGSLNALDEYRHHLRPNRVDLTRRNSVCTITHDELVAVAELLGNSVDPLEEESGASVEDETLLSPHERNPSSYLPLLDPSLGESPSGSLLKIPDASTISSRTNSTYSEASTSDFDHSSSEDQRQDIFSQLPPDIFLSSNQSKARHVAPLLIRRGSDSDGAPSLSSSTTSLSSSSRHRRMSPLTPTSALSGYSSSAQSPLEHGVAAAAAAALGSAVYLGSIEERQYEDHPDSPYRTTEKMDSLTIRPLPEEASKVNLSQINVNAANAGLLMKEYTSPTPWDDVESPVTSSLPPPSIMSTTSSGNSSSVKLNRLFGGGAKKDKQTPKSPKSFDSPALSGANSLIYSQETFLVVDPKAQKAEEKKRKKAEAKARTEKLAIELKRRQTERAELQSQHSAESKEKKKTNELASMYGQSQTWSALGV